MLVWVVVFLESWDPSLLRPFCLVWTWLPIAEAHVGSWKKKSKKSHALSIYLYVHGLMSPAIHFRGFGWNSVKVSNKMHRLAAILRSHEVGSQYNIEEGLRWTWVLDLPSCIPIHVAAFMFRLSVKTPPRRKQKTWRFLLVQFACVCMLIAEDR